MYNDYIYVNTHTYIYGLPWWLNDKESTCNAGDMGQENPLEKEMATHTSILAWSIPWTEEPGGLQSMGSQNKHNLVTKQQ